MKYNDKMPKMKVNPETYVSKHATFDDIRADAKARNSGRRSRWSGVQSGSCYRFTVGAEVLCLLKASSRQAQPGSALSRNMYVLKTRGESEMFPEIVDLCTGLYVLFCSVLVDSSLLLLDSVCTIAYYVSK